MKIKIESDVFDIVNRIKNIDENYFILFDCSKQKYELHNKSQLNTYCFTLPYENLDNRIFDMINYTNVCNIDKIIEDIDKNNTETERIQKLKINEMTNFMTKEIYNFASNSSKEFDESKMFSSVWS